MTNSEKPLLMSIKRDGPTYIVNTGPLPEGADDGATIIAAFKKGIESGTIDLASAYQRVENIMLRQIPEIATAAQLKGLSECSNE
jgi:hypothetical protein